MAMKLTKTFIITMGIVLGIIILFNAFTHGTAEGFQEGASSRPTTPEQTCDKKTCSKNKEVDAWFNGKTLNDISVFYNKTDGKLFNNKFPKDFKLSEKDTSCNNYIGCLSAKIKKAAESSTSDSSSSESTKSGESGGGGNREQILAALDSADSAIKSARASLK